MRTRCSGCTEPSEKRKPIRIDTATTQAEPTENGSLKNCGVILLASNTPEHSAHRANLQEPGTMSCTFATQPALLLLAALLSAPAAAFEHDLPPYPGVHGARISHEEARARLRSSGSDTPHEIYPANTKQTKPVRYHIEQTVGKWPSERFISGSLTVIPNPAEQFSFVPPLGGCVRNRIQPHITSKSHGCTYASNAGFFDVHNGDCLGELDPAYSECLLSAGVCRNFGFQRNSGD